MQDPKTIKAIDINKNAVYGAGVAYFRITPEMRDFISKKCAENHEVVGFEYTPGELNFGVIIKEKENE